MLTIETHKSLNVCSYGIQLVLRVVATNVSTYSVVRYHLNPPFSYHRSSGRRQTVQTGFQTYLLSPLPLVPAQETWNGLPLLEHDTAS